jgi:hypothetical protein
VTPDNLAKTEIDCRNCSNSGSRQRLAAASAAEVDMMVVGAVVVVNVLEWFKI